MLAAVEQALPADAAIMVAAVADWRAAAAADQKLQKVGSGKTAPLALVENPDIPATLGRHAKRPGPRAGFAAATHKPAAREQDTIVSTGADRCMPKDVLG